jgi:hypothetical protein
MGAAAMQHKFGTISTGLWDSDQLTRVGDSEGSQDLYTICITR